jgi:hypothetical protein
VAVYQRHLPGSRRDRAQRASDLLGIRHQYQSEGDPLMWSNPAPQLACRRKSMRGTKRLVSTCGLAPRLCSHTPLSVRTALTPSTNPKSMRVCSPTTLGVLEDRTTPAIYRGRGALPAASDWGWPRS